MMKKLFYPIILSLIVFSCSDNKIVISSEYIINENWSKGNEKGGGNSIRINKMKLKVDSNFKLSSNPENLEFIEYLKEDSLIQWFANVKIKEDSYRGKKIYFNRDNGFTWLNDFENKRSSIIGALDRKSWYKFSNLVSYPFYIYIYVDSANIIHRFDVNSSNY